MLRAAIVDASVVGNGQKPADVAKTDDVEVSSISVIQSKTAPTAPAGAGGAKSAPGGGGQRIGDVRPAGDGRLVVFCWEKRFQIENCVC